MVRRSVCLSESLRLVLTKGCVKLAREKGARSAGPAHSAMMHLRPVTLPQSSLSRPPLPLPISSCRPRRRARGRPYAPSSRAARPRSTSIKIQPTPGRSRRRRRRPPSITRLQRLAAAPTSTFRKVSRRMARKQRQAAVEEARAASSELVR